MKDFVILVNTKKGKEQLELVKRLIKQFNILFKDNFSRYRIIKNIKVSYKFPDKRNIGDMRIAVNYQYPTLKAFDRVVGIIRKKEVEEKN